MNNFNGKSVKVLLMIIILLVAETSPVLATVHDEISHNFQITETTEGKIIPETIVSEEEPSTRTEEERAIKAGRNSETSLPQIQLPLQVPEFGPTQELSKQISPALLDIKNITVLPGRIEKIFDRSSSISSATHTRAKIMIDDVSVEYSATVAFSHQSVERDSSGNVVDKPVNVTDFKLVNTEIELTSEEREKIITQLYTGRINPFKITEEHINLGTLYVRHSSKVYDGSHSATPSNTNASVSMNLGNTPFTAQFYMFYMYIYSNDVVGSRFLQKDVGNGLEVHVDSIKLTPYYSGSGTDFEGAMNRQGDSYYNYDWEPLENYIATHRVRPASISKRALNWISGEVKDKRYDGTTEVKQVIQNPILTGFVEGENQENTNLTTSFSNHQFVDSSVGVWDIEADWLFESTSNQSPPENSNYSVRSQPSFKKAEIMRFNPEELWLEDIDVIAGHVEKVYDGTKSLTRENANITKAPQITVNSVSPIVLKVSVDDGEWNFNDIDVNWYPTGIIDNVPLTINDVHIEDEEGNQYALREEDKREFLSSLFSGTILPRKVAWTKGKIDDKPYNQSKNIDLNTILECPELANLIPDDKVYLSINKGTLEFASSNVSRGINQEILPQQIFATGWSVSEINKNVISNYLLVDSVDSDTEGIRMIDGEPTEFQPSFEEAKILPLPVTFVSKITAKKVFDGLSNFDERNSKHLFSIDKGNESNFTGVLPGDELIQTVANLKGEHLSNEDGKISGNSGSGVLLVDDNYVAKLEGAQADNYYLVENLIVNSEITKAPGPSVELIVNKITATTLNIDSTIIDKHEWFRPLLRTIDGPHTAIYAISTEADSAYHQLIWQKTPNFTKLTPNSKYYIYSYVIESRNFFEGNPTILPVYTLKSEANDSSEQEKNEQKQQSAETKGIIGNLGDSAPGFSLVGVLFMVLVAWLKKYKQ
ncbi:hypothetical protein [Lactococcus allomyrinae]|uniref:Cna B-type domain-containing protein n=1 Tax=Lactococcus allomyrinae TaxID=2419773 RepID=A0A387BHH2_9LACT|nr:hypothetical protein [Lactococcus allomyrinae]AYG00330.1 hypothetical protein D7I46_04030 [Lactococcus allomyrinae]